MKKRVATAIVKVCETAGRSFGAKGDTENNAARVANLLRDGPYGPYIANGDPQEWGGGEAVATIYMEQKGGAGDCYLPLDYWGEEQESAFEVAARASDLLGDYYIEFCNAAVACVFKA